VLNDTLSSTFPDPDHSMPSEPRFVTIGMSDRSRILVVVHSEQAAHGANYQRAPRHSP